MTKSILILAIAVAFPAQKGTPAGDQIDIIMTSVGILKTQINGILIGL